MSWKKVYEELPKPNSKVIGYDASAQLVDMFYYTAYEEWWAENISVLSPTQVTHWMYVPEI